MDLTAITRDYPLYDGLQLEAFMLGMYHAYAKGSELDNPFRRDAYSHNSSSLINASQAVAWHHGWISERDCRAVYRNLNRLEARYQTFPG